MPTTVGQGHDTRQQHAIALGQARDPAALRSTGHAYVNHQVRSLCGDGGLADIGSYLIEGFNGLGQVVVDDEPHICRSSSLLRTIAMLLK